MLLDISSLQDKILKRYEAQDVDMHEIPVILQKTCENIAVLAYCAQKIENEIKDKVYAPNVSLAQARYILSDHVAGVRISECLDNLCQNPHLDAIIDVSTEVTITPENDLLLIVAPIFNIVA